MQEMRNRTRRELLSKKIPPGLMNGVESSGRGGVATAQTLQAHPQAFPGTIAIDGLAGIFRTRGRKPAGRGEVRRNHDLIPLDEEKKPLLKEFVHA
jgi:hypothetical protein